MKLCILQITRLNLSSNVSQWLSSSLCAYLCNFLSLCLFVSLYLVRDLQLLSLSVHSLLHVCALCACVCRVFIYLIFVFNVSSTSSELCKVCGQCAMITWRTYKAITHPISYSISIWNSGSRGRGKREEGGGEQSRKTFCSLCENVARINESSSKWKRGANVN